MPARANHVVTARDTVVVRIHAGSIHVHFADASQRLVDDDAVAGVTGDQPFPSTACRVGADLGATKAGGFGIAPAVYNELMRLQEKSHGRG